MTTFHLVWTSRRIRLKVHSMEVISVNGWSRIVTWRTMRVPRTIVKIWSIRNSSCRSIDSRMKRASIQMRIGTPFPNKIEPSSVIFCMPNMFSSDRDRDDVVFIFYDSFSYNNSPCICIIVCYPSSSDVSLFLRKAKNRISKSDIKRMRRFKRHQDQAPALQLILAIFDRRSPWTRRGYQRREHNGRLFIGGGITLFGTKVGELKKNHFLITVGTRHNRRMNTSRGCFWIY